MKLLKCADCGKEISITADKCPNCGSEKQFKGYIFYRKELAKEKITPMEMMRFQKHGGKIKIINWKKLFKYGGIAFVVMMVVGTIVGNQKVKYTKADGTVLEITQFELDEIEKKKEQAKEREELKKKEKEIFEAIKKTETFRYGLIAKGYERLMEINPSNKDYKKNYELFKKVDDTKYTCKRLVQERDRNSTIIKDSFKVVAGKKNRLEGWTAEQRFTYIYSYKVKNPFGVEVRHNSRNNCFYDDNFNLINIQKTN